MVRSRTSRRARRALILAALPAAILAAALPAEARTPRSARPAPNAGKLERSLMKLDPAELVAQVCDLGAMKALGRDPQYSRTDRVLIDAAGAPKIAGEKVTGDGGALRLGEKWLRFSYSCTLAPDHMSAVDFRYRITGPIPEEKWAEIGLWK